MPTACIHHPGSKIALESERLVVSYTDDDGHTQHRDIPLRDLERLILAEAASITTPALAEALRRGIPVSLVDFHGRFLGAFLPATPDHGASRLRHYQRALDPEFQLTIARNTTGDFQDRQVFLYVDGELWGKVKYGQPVTREIAPGRHTIRAFNTLFSHTIEADAVSGEREV